MKDKLKVHEIDYILFKSFISEELANNAASKLRVEYRIVEDKTHKMFDIFVRR